MNEVYTNLCESCAKLKKRSVENCKIQQDLHISDVINKTVSIIVECNSYTKKENEDSGN